MKQRSLGRVSRGLCWWICGSIWLCGNAREASGDSEKIAREPGSQAVFLFEYEPLPGQQAQFEAGYRRHLEWHRKAEDSIDWLAWYVATGPRSGRFIDGALDLSFSDFDARVEPAADRADFAHNVAPFARLVSRSVYRWRRDLGTAEEPTAESPAKMAEVSRVIVGPGQAAGFEERLAALRSTWGTEAKAPVYRWYQLVSGGEQPSYLLWIDREHWAEVATPDKSGQQGFRDVGLRDVGLRGERSLEPTTRGLDLLMMLSETIERLHTETWIYRQDLSYFAALP